MKTFALALAAASTLAATSAFAAPVDEIVADQSRPAQIVTTPEAMLRGQGAVVNGEYDGTTKTAALEKVRIVQYPAEARPTQNNGR